MANLTGVPVWSDVVQNETTTLVLGGAGGPMNLQAQSLANRTEWLKRLAQSCCSASDCGACDKTIWIPANDIAGTSGATHSGYALPAIVLYSLDFDPDVSEYGQFGLKMPPDWNRGPFWVELVWFTDSAPTAHDVQWEVQLVSIPASGAIGGVVEYAMTTISSSDGNADTFFVAPLRNLYPNNYQEGVQIHFVVRRDGADTDDTLDVDARLYGVNLHYTPTGCDTNLNSAFYFGTDSCLGQSHGGTWNTEIETTGTSIPLTAMAAVESNTYATLTFEVEFSGAEGAFNLVVSTAGTSFSSATVAVPVFATSATVTVDLASQLVAGEVITIAPDEVLSDPWRLVGVIASTLSAPSGCVTGIAP